MLTELRDFLDFLLLDDFFSLSDSSVMKELAEVEVFYRLKVNWTDFSGFVFARLNVLREDLDGLTDIGYFVTSVALLSAPGSWFTNAPMSFRLPIDARPVVVRLILSFVPSLT